MTSRFVYLFASLFFGSAACGGLSGVPLEGDAGDGASSDGHAPGDAPLDVIPDSPPADGPIACGDTTCEASEYCIHPCCGGIEPACVPPADAGGCPSGTFMDSTCGEFGSPPGASCRPDPCTPPPPYCSAKPSCDGESGGLPPEGHQVSCACA